MSFDIKFSFENPCRILIAEIGKLDIKRHLVFYLSVYKLVHTLNTSDYDVINDFCVNLTSSTTLFKKCNVMLTCKGYICREIDNVYPVIMQQCSLYER